MVNLLSRASSPYYINLPYHLVGWLGLVLFALALSIVLWRTWEPPRMPRGSRWVVFLALLLVAPLADLFIGIPMPGQTALPLPMIPAERGIPDLMFFAAVPWVFAAGMFGPLPAAALGLLSGLVIGFNETHSWFTPLQLCALALAFSYAVRQRYRTPFYRLLRHPLAAAFLLALAFVPIYMICGFFEIDGPVAVQLDYAITQTWPVILARGVEFVIAGLFAELLLLLKASIWPRPAILVPSPAEVSLESRFFYATLPLALGLIFTLMVADWIVAGNAARRMLRDRLSSTAQVASESLPYFLEAGQNLISNLATPDLLDLSSSQLQDELSKRLRLVPYFRQLYLVDAEKQPVSGYPVSDFKLLQVTAEEQTGMILALKGVAVQSYIVPPVQDETTAQISFLALIHDENDKPLGVLIGRTDLNSNPFTQPAIDALKAVQDSGGDGVILDEDNRILYSAIPARVMDPYFGQVPASSSFFDENSEQGTRRLVFTQPVPGRKWNIILSVPAQLAQQTALEIAVPLLAVLITISIVVFLLMRLSLRAVTRSLQSLSLEAGRISQGELSHALNVTGEDEVGRLSSSFERMRVSLKARLDELNRLLLVSQGIASTLEVKDSVRPILEAALNDGASSARIVLLREVTLDSQGDRVVSFGLGSSNLQYAYLDEQIFDLMRAQEILTIPNTARVRRLNFASGKSRPAAVMARALRHENSYYGMLWITYEQPHVFNDEEVRFFSTLAGQAALAAANSRLYSSAEVGRQRLEAVLSSTPEPVLVTDGQGCLLLLNPAALQVTGLVTSSTPGRPIREIISIPALQELLSGSFDSQPTSQEITLQNGRIYFASVSPVTAEGQAVGRVCILRDITHYKELDALKSEFVATVSHDLRSPLTLLRGYATMLQMVGDLNEQQKSYLRKINQGVETMTRLVNNLLDLNRIEAGIDLQLEKVSAGDVIEQVFNTLQPQAIQKNITLSQEIPQGQSVVVEADAALLQQAFYNLVENAIKYTPVGGQVKVCLRARPEGVIFEVHDNGIGVAPLDLPRLFEKFFRSGRREAYQQRGTGLGLAIVKSIAERHGGRAWVESTLGKGSNFYIEVPYQQKRPE